MIYVEFMKNFLLADSSELMAVRLILASEPKNKWFLLCRHDLRRVHEKCSSGRFERADFLAIASKVPSATPTYFHIPLISTLFWILDLAFPSITVYNCLVFHSCHQHSLWHFFRNGFIMRHWSSSTKVVVSPYRKKMKSNRSRVMFWRFWLQVFGKSHIILFCSGCSL